MQRRTFVVGAGAAFVCLAVLPDVALADGAPPDGPALLDQEGLSKLLGETLMVGAGGRSLPLSLNALQADASRFTLLLTGSAEMLLADGVATIEHAGFGSQRLTIACYGVGEGAARYRIECAHAT